MKRNTNLHAYQTPPPPPRRSRPTAFEDIEDMLPIEEPPVIAPPIKPIDDPPAAPRPRPTVANNYNKDLGRKGLDWLAFIADLAGALVNPSITRLRFEQEQANHQQENRDDVKP